MICRVPHKWNEMKKRLQKIKTGIVNKENNNNSSKIKKRVEWKRQIVANTLTQAQAEKKPTYFEMYILIFVIEYRILIKKAIKCAKKISAFAWNRFCLFVLEPVTFFVYSDNDIQNRFPINLNTNDRNIKIKSEEKTFHRHLKLKLKSS